MAAEFRVWYRFVTDSGPVGNTTWEQSSGNLWIRVISSKILANFSKSS